MTKDAASAKTSITHPRTGTKLKIDASLYAAFKSAILRSLKGSQGKTFTEISSDTATFIRKKIPGFKGSIPWYTISVRLDLESREMVEIFSEKGKKRCRLKAPVAPGRFSK